MPDSYSVPVHSFPGRTNKAEGHAGEIFIFLFLLFSIVYHGRDHDEAVARKPPILWRKVVRVFFFYFFKTKKKKKKGKK